LLVGSPPNFKLVVPASDLPPDAKRLLTDSPAETFHRRQTGQNFGQSSTEIIKPKIERYQRRRAPGS